MGDVLVDVFHLIGLFVIGASIVWAAVMEFIHIIHTGTPGLHDILLLFIYLELGAMVGIYFKTNRMPVQFLLYITVTALTRVLIIDIKQLHDERVLVITGGILLVSLAVLAIRFGANRFPSCDEDSQVSRLS